MEIEFLGGIREIGGSCIAVESNGEKVALDYGIKVGEKDSHHLPQDFDLVVISHAHLDHSGSLLRLSRSKPVIIGSEMTRDVTSELLQDMVKIQHRKDDHFPYNRKDANNIRKAWWVRDEVALPGIKIRTYPAGHVAGARMTSVHAEGKEMLYTGDFCLHDTQILEGTNIEKLPKEPDALVIESTYGGTIRPPRGELVDQLLNQVRDTIDREGNILIPSFAFHRTQEMAKRIDRAMQEGEIPDYHAYTISNLAYKITEHFNHSKGFFTENIRKQKRPFFYQNIKPLWRTKQIKEPAIVICTSGFGHAGASRHLLEKWASNEDDSVIINSGYLPPNSPLKMAKEENEIVNNGSKTEVQAEIEQIELSGHADQTELIQLVEKLRPKKTFLVHGEIEQAEALAGKISGMTEVHIPEENEKIAM